MSRSPIAVGIALLLASLVACDDADPRPITPRADASRPDRGLRLDAGPQPDADSPDDAAPPEDAGLDAGPDMLPPVPGPDDATQIVMLSLRNASQVAWVAEGVLYAAHLSDDGGAPVTRRLFAVPDPLPGPLLAGRVNAAPAWLFVPDGPDGAYRAYDLTLDAPEPQDTDLYAPAQVVVAESVVQLIGRAGPESDAPVAWRQVVRPDAPAPDAGVPDADVLDAGTEDAAPDAGEPEPDAAPTDERIIDRRGVPDVTGTAAGLAGVVLAFDSGFCAVMRAATLGDEWDCRSRDEARLIGASERLYFVAQHPDGIAAWSALPGFASDIDAPDGLERSLIAPGGTLLEWLPSLTSSRVARVRDHLCQPGAACRVPEDCGADQTCFDAQCVARACEADADCGDGQRCGEGACHARCETDATCLDGQICADGGCRDLPCDPAAPVCAPGRACVEGEGVWYFENDRARRLTWPGDHTGAIYIGRGVPYAVHWATEDGQPIVERLATLAYGRVPQSDVPADCRPPLQPEDCTGTDRNCDGAPRGGRCCTVPGLQGDRTEATLPGPPIGEWSMIFGDNRLYLVAAFDRGAGSGVEMHGVLKSATNVSSQPIVRWSAAETVSLVANSASRVVAVGHTPDEPDQLLWYLGDGDLGAGSPPEGLRSALPCQPVLSLDLLDGGDPGPTAHVHCADASYAITAPGDPSTPLARPEGEPVRWMTRRALGRDTLTLVARGDDHTLELWQRTAEGYVIPDPADAALPTEITMIIPQERNLPIHTAREIGGWATRIVDGKWLEALHENGRWRRAPATRWPSMVRVSLHEPMAVTLGEPVGPSDPTAIRQLWFHALGPGDTYWGQHRTDTPRNISAQNQGVVLGDYPVTAFSTPVPVTIEGAETGTLRSRVTACTPTP